MQHIRGGKKRESSIHREEIGNFLLGWYDRLAAAEKVLHSNHIVLRVVLFPVILFFYVGMLVVIFGLIVHVPSAQVFAHFQQINPRKGYTVSYVEFQHRLFVAQMLILTSVVVGVCLFYYFFVIPALGLYQS